VLAPSGAPHCSQQFAQVPPDTLRSCRAYVLGRQVAQRRGGAGGLRPELRARARREADELGPEPPGPELGLWREERWGAVVLLAGLADDDAELLRQPAKRSLPSGPTKRPHACCWMRRRSPRSAPRDHPRPRAPLLVSGQTVCW
jgi:hypothetical protein